MPHIVTELSSGAENVVKVAQVVDAAHRAALESGVLPAGGVRTFARISPHSRVLDGSDQNGFV